MKCNTAIETPRWGFRISIFSGPVVGLVLDVLGLVMGGLVQGCRLGQVLSDEAVCVLVAAPFPSTVGVGEVHLGTELFGDCLMSCKLSSVVKGDGPAQEPLHVAQDSFGDMVGPPVVKQGDDGVQGFAPGHGRHGAPVSLSDDGVALPVPEPVLAADCGRPFLDADPSEDVPPVFPGVPALSSASVCPAQAFVEVPALALVLVDEPVDGLVGGHGDAFPVRPSLDLFVAPVLLGELPADVGLHFPVDGLASALVARPCRGTLLGGLGIVQPMGAGEQLRPGSRLMVDLSTPSSLAMADWL
jgi:hypothetical protein